MDKEAFRLHKAGEPLRRYRALGKILGPLNNITPVGTEITFEDSVYIVKTLRKSKSSVRYSLRVKGDKNPHNEIEFEVFSF